MERNGVPHEIPLTVWGTSPVSSFPQPGLGGPSLPLSLIAHIISYFDDVADIASMTRTCRLMYYMTLPVLYEKVTLQSYSELRYHDGRPEGYGSGSPFAMALSGLAIGNAAGLVKELGITGSWSEPKMDEYTKGKIPDSTILLGIAMRSAIDRMIHLRSFRWSLDIKPTMAIYSGLSARSSLTCLELRFPNSRSPRPVSIIPPIPNLLRLRVSHLDPLCYPDDLSTLLLHAKKLQDLRIHWSPRMRLSAEPSINLRSLFGPCLSANHKIPLKHLGLQNFYGANTGELSEISDLNTLESTDFLDVFGGNNSDPTTVWFAETWKNIPGPEYFRKLRRARISETAVAHARILESTSGLEELYIIDHTSLRPTQTQTPPSSTTTPPTTTSTPCKPNKPTPPSLCTQYISALTTHHNSTLRTLLLSPQWPLSGPQISLLTSSCPHLSQLAFAPASDTGDALTLLSPFLKNLHALRLLKNVHVNTLCANPELQWLLAGKNKGDDGSRKVYWRLGDSSMRWVGLGDKILRVGKAVRVVDDEGRWEWNSEVELASKEDVREVEVWKYDCMEL